jgi:hypothetical protein
MKVSGSWEMIQLVVKSEEATGKNRARHKQKLATNGMIHVFKCTWHVAKIPIIDVKYH